MNMDNISNNVSGNDNFCINNTGTINLNNPTSSFNEHTQLKETGIKRVIFRRDLTKKFREQSIIAIIPVAMGVLANFTNILQYLGIPPLEGGKFLILLVGFTFLGLFSQTLTFNLWYYFLRKNSNSTFLIHNGNYYFLNPSKEQIAETSLSAKCIYPSCQGEIFLRAAPTREKHRNIIGSCTIDNKNHTYSVDNNFVLYKCSMDWRPTTNNTTQ